MGNKEKELPVKLCGLTKSTREKEIKKESIIVFVIVLLFSCIMELINLIMSNYLKFLIVFP